MSMKFSDIIDNAPDTLEASKPLPAGEYVVQVIKAEVQELKFDFGDHREGDENLMVFLKPVEPADVDEEELAECENWRNELLTIRIFPEEMGDRFCDMKSERGLVYNLGMDPADYEDIGGMIAATVGKKMLATVVHSPNKKDPDRPYTNIKQTAAL